MQASTNFGFKLPESTDPVNIGDINYNFSWIDANIPDSTSVKNMFDGFAAATGIQPCVFGEFEGGYYSTAAVGGTMTLTRTSYTGFASAMLSVSPGDIVTITATGTGTSSSTGATVYAITDSNKIVLEVGAQNAALVDAVLRMPANAAYIVVNNKTAEQAYPSLVKGATNQVAGIVKRVDSGLELAHRRLDSIWAYGRVDGSNGRYVTANAKRRRTTSPCGVAEGIFAADAHGTDYSFYVFAYKRLGSSIYVGAWDDTNQTWIAAATGYSAVKYFDFSAYPEYKFQLALCTDNDGYILARDIIDVYFDVSPVNSNIDKIDEHERMLGDIAQPAVVNAVTTYHIVPVGSTSRVTMLANAHIKSDDVSYGDYGTISNTAASDTVYYVQVAEDSVLYVNTDHSPATCRTSMETPVKDTSTTAKWTGRISRTMPTQEAPWVVPANYYIAVCAEGGLAAGESIDICVAPLGYSLSAAVKDTISSMISTDYSTAENMSRVSDVYAALDAIENNSGSRMSHSDISDVIDDSTKIRAYKINTTPKYIDWEFDIQTSAPLFDKPKVLIIATIHGNERGNVLNLIEFCKNLLNNAEYADIAGRIEWHIIPVVNIWGYNHTMVDGQGNVIWYSTDGNYTVVENTSELRGGVYRNGSSINLNQAFSDDDTETTVETRAVRDYFLANAPFIACIDLHQWYTTAGSSAPVIGMASLVADNNALLVKYQHGREALAAGGGEAETYARARYGSGSSWWAKQQLVYPYGEPNFTTPASSRTSRAYFAGVGGNTFHQDVAVPFSSTFESAMIMRFMTNVYTPYTEMERTCANVFVQKSLAALARAALEEFA